MTSLYSFRGMMQLLETIFTRLAYTMIFLYSLQNVIKSKQVFIPHYSLSKKVLLWKNLQEAMEA